MEVTKRNPIQKKGILVYGGAFNPPTAAHADIIEQARLLNDYDEIWVMPSRSRTDKQNILDQQERTIMLKKMIDEVFDDNSNIVVSDFELRLPGPSATHLTFGVLFDQYPEYEFTYLVGEDSIASIREWKESEWLLENIKWLICSRGNEDIVDWPRAFKYLNNDSMDVSSTLVRNNIRQNLPVDGLVCSSVYRHIIRRGLYV